MRVLDYAVEMENPDPPHPGLRPRPAKGFVLAFKLHCQKCGLTDFTRICNLRWQEATQEEAIKMAALTLPARRGAERRRNKQVDKLQVDKLEA